MRKSQAKKNKYFFHFFLLIKKSLYFVRKDIWKNLVYTVIFVLKFRTST